LHGRRLEEVNKSSCNHSFEPLDDGAILIVSGTKVLTYVCRCGQTKTIEKYPDDPDYASIRVKGLVQPEEEGCPTIQYFEVTATSPHAQQIKPEPPRVETPVFTAQVRHHAETIAIAITVLTGFAAVGDYVLQHHTTIFPAIIRVFVGLFLAG
jgi:hypothetical protein